MSSEVTEEVEEEAEVDSPGPAAEVVEEQTEEEGAMVYAEAELPELIHVKTDEVEGPNI